MASPKYFWLDGQFVPFSDAKVHVLTHSLQYASGIFEGIRAYDTEKGPAVFRLVDHMTRFYNSAKLFNIKLPYRQEELEAAVLDTVKKNGLKSCYIRPFGFYNDHNIGLGVSGKKVSVGIGAVEFGAYFDKRDTGIKAIISSWHRAGPDTLPAHGKASGNYTNATLASEEAKAKGGDEAIMLSSKGYVAEGPGENIFLVKGDELITPSIDSDILIGITRDTVKQIAKEQRIKVVERHIKPNELYTADEIFFTGTAAEITPITQVNGKVIGKGKVGLVSSIIAKEYSDIVYGKNAKFADWISYA